MEIKTISIEDKNYPKILKEIVNPPKILYYLGEIKVAAPKGRAPLSEAEREENCFAIVGTRRYSPYGKQVALEIAGDLAEAGLTIVPALLQELILLPIRQQLKEIKEQLPF